MCLCNICIPVYRRDCPGLHLPGPEVPWSNQSRVYEARPNKQKPATEKLYTLQAPEQTNPTL